MSSSEPTPPLATKASTPSPSSSCASRTRTASCSTSSAPLRARSSAPRSPTPWSTFFRALPRAEPARAFATPAAAIPTAWPRASRIRLTCRSRVKRVPHKTTPTAGLSEWFRTSSPASGPDAKIALPTLGPPPTAKVQAPHCRFGPFTCAVCTPTPKSEYAATDLMPRPLR